MRFTSEVYWDKGERILNEDSISLQEVRVKGEKVVFAVVCDGIGGLDYGEVASGFVTERMTEWFYKEALMMLKRLGFGFYMPAMRRWSDSARKGG